MSSLLFFLLIPNCFLNQRLDSGPGESGAFKGANLSFGEATSLLTTSSFPFAFDRLRLGGFFDRFFAIGVIVPVSYKNTINENQAQIENKIL